MTLRAALCEMICLLRRLVISDCGRWKTFTYDDERLPKTAKGDKEVDVAIENRNGETKRRMMIVKLLKGQDMIFLES